MEIVMSLDRWWVRLATSGFLRLMKPTGTRGVGFSVSFVGSSSCVTWRAGLADGAADSGTLHMIIQSRLAWSNRFPNSAISTALHGRGKKYIVLINTLGSA